jgi:hypothetical protein
MRCLLPQQALLNPQLVHFGMINRARAMRDLFVIGLTCDLHLLFHENRTEGDPNLQTFHVRRSHNTEEEEVMGHH